MKRAGVLLGVGLLVLTSCGVDRNGTRDNVVSQMEAAGRKADGDCIDAVLDEYTDDELEAIENANIEGTPSTDSDELQLALLACSTIDREVTAEAFVAQAEAEGGSADRGCIDEVLDRYSDDDLRAIDEAMVSDESSDAAVAIFTELSACITPDN